MTYHQELLLENDYDVHDAVNTTPGASQHKNADPSSIIAVNSQIQHLWGEMSALRQDYTIKDQIKELELVRLIEVHNKLDIEEQRGLELYTKSFMDSLKLYELGIQPSILGGVKCYIQPPSVQKSHKAPTHANSTGAINNPFSEPNHQTIEQIDATRNEIVARRKAEITHTLIELNRRSFLTAEDEQLKASLMEELRSLQ